jgi:hypothetical protein
MRRRNDLGTFVRTATEAPASPFDSTAWRKR